ncbi:hypothetical protein SAMN05216257_101164 [Meinhardsimonia xiamenensis]|uniref:Uncharacterized protein n=1 Tax=Meinhardsimonia xiamenensis TaxID=990712 RepID=A0A1G8Y2X7_9RHOB|nr:hypothetical protein LV81_00920 [Meinhardsimonia xiamenensis]SDJ97182.1 hypothetical protein SAMN05216257_101164 [Meinhardsimonia xiamenensis]
MMSLRPRAAPATRRIVPQPRTRAGGRLAPTAPGDLPGAGTRSRAWRQIGMLAPTIVALRGCTPGAALAMTRRLRR